jgi:hypothetical protein
MRLTRDSRSLTGSAATMPYLSVWSAVHRLHAEHAAAASLERPRHLRQARLGPVDEVVGQVDEERFVADHRARTQYCMTEPERRRLADVDAAGVGRHDAANCVEQVSACPWASSSRLELLVGVEMVFDRALGGPRDEDELLGTGTQWLRRPRTG